MMAALGPMPSSYLSQLIASHKQTYQHIVARQEKEQHALEKTQKEALTRLDASFRVATWQAKKAAKGNTVRSSQAAEGKPMRSACRRPALLLQRGLRRFAGGEAPRRRPARASGEKAADPSSNSTT